MILVPDASVLLKWVLEQEDEPDHCKAIQLQQAVLQGLGPMGDLVATGLFFIAQFQPVQRAGRSQRFALLVLAPFLGQRIGLAGGHGQQRVTAQEVVVVEVLITQRQAVNPLGDQFLDRMLDEQWVAVITKAGGHLAAEAQALVDLAQEQRAAVTVKIAAAEVGDDAAGAPIGEEQWLGVGQDQGGRNRLGLGRILEPG